MTNYLPLFFMIHTMSNEEITSTQIVGGPVTLKHFFQILSHSLQNIQNHIFRGTASMHQKFQIFNYTLLCFPSLVDCGVYTCLSDHNSKKHLLMFQETCFNVLKCLKSVLHMPRRALHKLFTCQDELCCNQLSAWIQLSV